MISESTERLIMDLSTVSGINICCFHGGMKERQSCSEDKYPAELISFMRKMSQNYRIAEYLDNGYACNVSFQIGIKAVYLPICQDTYLEIGPYTSTYLSIDEVTARLNEYGITPTNSIIHFFADHLPIFSEERINVIKRIICSVLDIRIIKATTISDVGDKPTIIESLSAEDIAAKRKSIERHDTMLSFLNALSEGNYEKCLQIVTEHPQYHLDDYFFDAPLLNERVKAIYYASLFSFITINSGVSPVSADLLFRQFIQNISNLSSADEITRESFSMLRSFCDLVKKNHSSHSPFVNQIVNYLSIHINTPLNIDDLCQIHNLPRNKLEAEFKRECGTSIAKYHQNLRLEKSIQLLGDKALFISQVAQQVGFLDQNYFSRIFKKHYGCTPNQYRKTLVQNPSGFSF